MQTKMLITLLVTLFVSGNAFSKEDFGHEKHISGRYVKKIFSRSEEKEHSHEFMKAREQDGYRVEIERVVEGLSGFTHEKEIPHTEFPVEIGIDLTAGMSVINSVFTKTLKEAQDLHEINPLDYFYASKAISMHPEESIHFDFVAGLLVSAGIEGAGAMGVATGGWDVHVFKKEEHSVEVDFSLLDTKMVSYYFEKFEAMLSYDIGKTVENGFTIEFNLEDSEARVAYENLFKGNIAFAQEKSSSNKNILFIKRSHSLKKYKGVSYWQSSPLVAWFLVNSSHYLSNENAVEFYYQTKLRENHIISAYTEESELDFLGLYYGVNRNFRASYNVETKHFSVSDHYDVEGNAGRNVGKVLKRMLFKTRMHEFFDYNVPNVDNQAYGIKLAVKYDEDFLKHLISGRVDLNFLNREALKNVEDYYIYALNQSKKVRDAYTDNPVSLMQDKHLEEAIVGVCSKKLQEYTTKMQKSWAQNNIKDVLANYSALMKYVYQSPGFYKALVDYSKRCGTEVEFELETQAFAKKKHENVLEKKLECLF